MIFMLPWENDTTSKVNLFMKQSIKKIPKTNKTQTNGQKKKKKSFSHVTIWKAYFWYCSVRNWLPTSAMVTVLPWIFQSHNLELSLYAII